MFLDQDLTSLSGYIKNTCTFQPQNRFKSNKSDLTNIVILSVWYDAASADYLVLCDLRSAGFGMRFMYDLYRLVYV